MLNGQGGHEFQPCMHCSQPSNPKSIFRCVSALESSPSLLPFLESRHNPELTDTKIGQKDQVLQKLWHPAAFMTMALQVDPWKVLTCTQVYVLVHVVVHVLTQLDKSKLRDTHRATWLTD